MNASDLPRPRLSRRRFGQLLAGAVAVRLIDTPSAALLGRGDRLSWRAHRTAGAEGTWELKKIDGELPADLVGTLYRTAPGESERAGTKFRHLFDGDAYLSGYSFRDGKVTLRGQFLDGPQRRKELEAGKMLYSEFGTLAPGTTRAQFKNQPSVNIIAYDGQLLGLSEGGHPTAIDPETFEHRGEWDFHGSLPAQQSFTAHPKFDADGTGYCYGIVQGMGMALRVFRMEANGKVTRLHEMVQPGYFMIHDMVLTKDHIVFLIPPVTYDLGAMFGGKTSIADCLRYGERGALRIVIMRKDGTGRPVVVKQPAAMVFHHGNAFEKDGIIHVDTFLTGDGSILRQLHQWSKDRLPKTERVRAVRLSIDPAKREVVARDEFGEGCEFPRFDDRRTGQDLRYLYCAGEVSADDEFAFQGLVRHDRGTGKAETLAVAAHQTVAEPVFVPRGEKGDENDGWLLQLGYDGRRDETFLDVVDGKGFERMARVWTGTHIPLGFHGSFARDMFVKA